MYRGGDQRLKIEGKPAQPPGVPMVLGGERYQALPISLPPPAFYPGLQPFVQQEELAKRRADIAAAETALLAAADEKARPPLEAKLAAAKAELASIEARIAADNARYGASVDADALAKSAAKAEREAKAAAARAEVAAAELAAVQAEALPADDKKAAAVKAAQDRLTAVKNRADGGAGGVGERGRQLHAAESRSIRSRAPAGGRRWRGGSPVATTRSRPASRPITSGGGTSASRSCRRSPTSAATASRRRIPNCSTGSPPS